MLLGPQGSDMCQHAAVSWHKPPGAACKHPGKLLVVNTELDKDSGAAQSSAFCVHGQVLAGSNAASHAALTELSSCSQKSSSALEQAQPQ